MSTYLNQFHRELTVGREALNERFRSGSPRVLRAGQLLIAAAQPSDALYRLRGGWAYRFRKLSDGSLAIVDVYLPGDIIGLDAARCNKETENVRTLTTTGLEVAAAEQGLWGLMTSPQVAFYISYLLSERQQRSDRILASISLLDSRGRMAAMILNFYQRLAVQKMITALSFNLPLTQHQIGSFLGMTVVHVNRVLRALRDAEVVIVEKHHVTILDLSHLAALANEDVKTASSVASG